MKIEASIVVAIISALTVAVGWIVAHHLARRRDLEARVASERRADDLRRLELSLQQIDRRVSELYGPIHNMLRQIWATWEIKHQKLRPVLNDDTYTAVEHYLEQKHFAELHDKIILILREKAHLVDGGIIPDSFYAYMQHSIMQNIQIDLWESRKISTIDAQGFPWSRQFAADIQSGLLNALQERKSLIAQLQSNRLS